jgi:hypothetical protein
MRWLKPSFDPMVLVISSSVSSATALGDYELWGSVLEASFGARRFVKLGVSASDIYR